MSPLILLSLCAILFVLALAGYALHLLRALRRQTQQQQAQHQAAITQRNDKIIESVDVIALAALQGQCDLSEAAIRLFMIMVHLQGDKQVDFASSFPATYELYQVVKDMPRGEERKKIAKKARMQGDLTRLKAEAKLQQAIHAELEEILAFTGARTWPERALSS